MPHLRTFGLALSFCAVLGTGCAAPRLDGSPTPSPEHATAAAVDNERGVFNNGIFAFEFPTSTEDGSHWTAAVSGDASRVTLHGTGVSGGLSFGTERNPEKLDLRTWISRQAYAKDVKNIRDVSYNGEKGISYIVVEFDGHVDSKYVAFSRGEDIVDIYDDHASPLPITERVLKTFRFVK